MRAFQGPAPGEADPGPDLTEASQTLGDAGTQKYSPAQPKPPAFRPRASQTQGLLPETGPGPSVPLKERTLMLGCTCPQVVAL